MEELTLVIGNKNYSSWSLRPWLLLKYFEIPFKEVLVPLYEGDYKERLLKFSPSGKVPILVHGRLAMGESLAIMEYVSELFPQKPMWPSNREQRAQARAISHEMHAGFVKLRKHMPMNVRGRHPGQGLTPEVEKDIARIQEIWTGCRKEFGSKGKFLFGPFTIADAMYAPVVTRFNTYGVKLSKEAQEYAQTILDLPAIQEWTGASTQESYVVAASEIYSRKV